MANVGRKPSPEKRDKRINLHLTDVEYSKLLELAGADDLVGRRRAYAVADFARAKLLNQVQPIRVARAQSAESVEAARNLIRRIPGLLTQVRNTLDDATVENLKTYQSNAAHWRRIGGWGVLLLARHLDETAEQPLRARPSWEAWRAFGGAVGILNSTLKKFNGRGLEQGDKNPYQIAPLVIQKLGEVIEAETIR